MRRRQLPHLEQLLAVVLEQRLARRQADVVAALGSGGAESRALAAREEQSGHLATCNHRQPTAAHLRRLGLGNISKRLGLEGRELLVGALLLRVGERGLEELR